MKVRHSWHPSERSALAAALETPEVRPLGAELSSVPTEAEVHRMWQSLRERPAPSRVRPVGIALAFSAVVVALALVFWLRFEPAGPLLAQGAQLPSTLVSADETKLLELSDGSRITLDLGGRIDVLGNDKRTFVTTLRRGTAHFEVEPGGPRRWVVEAGLVSVEVVGTGFTVERTDDEVTVSVDHGIVLVRGEFPGSERRLTAGQSLVARGQVRRAAEPSPAQRQAPQGVGADPASTSSTGAESRGVVAAVAAPSEAAGGPAAVAFGAAPSAAVSTSMPGSNASGSSVSGSSVSGSSVSGAAVRANGNAASGTRSAADVEPRDVRAVSKDPVDEALHAADEARRTGDVDRAAELYAVAASKAGAGDPRRGMAALSYARTSKNPARAAALLEASLDSMSPGLVEPAWAHLAESHGRAGHLQEARASAKRYIERYPTHPRAEKVKRWLEAR